MTYLTAVLNIVLDTPSLVVAVLGGMLVCVCFLRPRWKWWLYPVLLMFTFLSIPILDKLFTTEFHGPNVYSILITCLGYWVDILVLISFRERLGATITLIFTLSIFNRMFVFLGYVLHTLLQALTRGRMDMAVSVVLAMAVMYVILSLICWLFLRKKGRALIQMKGNRRNWVVLAGIAVSAKLIIDFCSNYAFNLNPSSDSKIIWAMIALCVFYIAVLILYLYSISTTRKHLELKASSDRLTFEKEAQQRYYETQFHNQEELHRMKHDMDGHLATISRLLEGDNKEEAVRYLADLGNYTVSHQEKIYSDDPYLNAVVTNYAAVFAENGIPFEHDIQLGRMELHHVEICLALNNALQNALEASLKLPPEQRYVKLQVKAKQNRFLFRLTNRFHGELIADGGLPCSTKEGTGHGYGLSSIRNAAESLGGFAECKGEGDMFVIDVAM